MEFRLRAIRLSILLGFLGVCLLTCSPVIAQSVATCQVSGAVGVAFSANLAATCTNPPSTATVCPLVSGSAPYAPGIATLSGCTLSGTPTQAGNFDAGVFQVGAANFEVQILIGGGPPSACAQNINTVAGSGIVSGPALAALLWQPQAVATDSHGNLYITGPRSQVYKVDPAGNLTVFAGNATYAYAGDGGPATSASFDLYLGNGILAVDGAGNLFIADSYHEVIRRVSGTTGIVTTVAGNGAGGTSGDGGPATSAGLNYPNSVTVDRFGNLFIATPGSFGDVIRRVDGATGIITTVAGMVGSIGYSGDGGPATAAQLNEPDGVAVDGAGNLYIADSLNNVVRAVNTQTTPTTIAGVSIQPGDIATVAGQPCTMMAGCLSGGSGDGGPATSASISQPVGVVLDGSGNLFIASRGSAVIRRVDGATGIITTVVGNGTAGYSGDGGAATSAELGGALGLALDLSGDLFIADTGNNRIREVAASTGIITTVAGGGTGVGDGGPATAAQLWLSNNPLGGFNASVALDASNNLLIGDLNDSRIRRVDASTGIITTVAGNGTVGDTGDGGPATSAEIGVGGIAVDAAGDIYLPAGGMAGLVRRVDGMTGIISTLGSSPGGTYDVAVDGAGNLYVATPGAVVRLDASTGNTTIVASSPTIGGITSVAVDGSGNLYIADLDNNVIRALNTQATAITVAGIQIQPGSMAIVAGGGNSTLGDGGPATSASLALPRGVTVSTLGNLFIADSFDGLIRRVDGATGIITTVAGNGSWGFTGDGGCATSAELALPSILAVDNSGHLYVPDADNNRIRKVDLPPVAVLSGTSLSFGSESYGTTSSPQTLTLKNTGEGTLSPVNISVIGDFAEMDTCGLGVAAGATCMVMVTFTPTESGARAGTLTIADNAPGSPQTVQLTGTGAGQAAAAPVFSPATGSYPAGQMVAISDATAGATIYYAINGTPTTASTVYTGAITVNSTETIEAIAVASGDFASAVATATYTILPAAATPSFSPPPGTYTSAQMVTISDATSGAAIYYAINETPTTASTVYTGAITVSSTETIEAIGAASGFSASAVASATYTINPPPDYQVSVTPNALTIVAGQSGKATFTVTPENGFNSQVNFACSGLPAEAACSFSPASVTPNGAAISSTLTITTTAASAAPRAPIAPALRTIYALLFLAPAVLLGIDLLRGRARAGLRFAGLLIVLAMMAGLSSCGGGSGGSTTVGNPGTPPGPAIVSVSASTSGAGAINHSATLTITITQ